MHHETQDVGIEKLPSHLLMTVLNYLDYSSDLSYELVLRRRPAFFARFMLLPVIFLSTMVMMIFWIPPQRPDRTGLGENMEASSKTKIPWIRRWSIISTQMKCFLLWDSKFPLVLLDLNYPGSCLTQNQTQLILHSDCHITQSFSQSAGHTLIDDYQIPPGTQMAMDSIMWLYHIVLSIGMSLFTSFMLLLLLVVDTTPPTNSKLGSLRFLFCIGVSPQWMHSLWIIHISHFQIPGVFCCYQIIGVTIATFLSILVVNVSYQKRPMPVSISVSSIQYLL